MYVINVYYITMFIIMYNCRRVLKMCPTCTILDKHIINKKNKKSMAREIRIRAACAYSYFIKPINSQ